jgi:HTH-type transcriptional regulator / antitoxin HigA
MATRTRASRKAPPDSYFDLVKRFPLRKLRTDADHAAAIEFSDPLMRRASIDELDDGEGDYLFALGLVIQEYERGRFLRDARKPTPLEVLKFLMEQRDMTPGDLARVIGSNSAASMILHGEREMSKGQIRRLAGHFGVSPALFL